jgi:hypothetical protein
VVTDWAKGQSAPAYTTGGTPTPPPPTTPYPSSSTWKGAVKPGLVPNQSVTQPQNQSQGPAQSYWNSLQGTPQAQAFVNKFLGSGGSYSNDINSAYNTMRSAAIGLHQKGVPGMDQVANAVHKAHVKAVTPQTQQQGQQGQQSQYPAWAYGSQNYQQ